MENEYVECPHCHRVYKQVNMRYNCVECSRKETTIKGPWVLFQNKGPNRKKEEHQKGQWMATIGTLPVWVYDSLELGPGDRIITEIKDENSPSSTVYKILERKENFGGIIVKIFPPTKLYDVKLHDSDEILKCFNGNQNEGNYEVGNYVIIRKGDFMGGSLEGCILRRHIPYDREDDEDDEE